MIEETDYKLELENSTLMTEACAKLYGYIYPKYYPELSSDKIITMDWIDGQHLPEFATSNASQKEIKSDKKSGIYLSNIYVE